MISNFASPSVCVIDDEAEDYRPILDALLKVGIGCVHIYGDTASPLPPEPFKGLRVVFTDLYLSGSSGKTAAAHTANVFKRVVSADTAPVLVVIWSKHTNDPAGDMDLPPDDQPSTAELFKTTLLEAEPNFKHRLIFSEMAKPKPTDRPVDSAWVDTLQDEIKNVLQKYPSCEMLWTWESLVRDAELSISGEMTSLALLKKGPGQPESENPSIDDALKSLFQLLVREQGGSHCPKESAPRHLITVLAQALLDHLEHSKEITKMSRFSEWLGDFSKLSKSTPYAAQLNGVLLTAAISNSAPAFVPGTVYLLEDASKLDEFFGVKCDELLGNFYTGKKELFEEWKSKVKHIAIEISPSCDFQQGTRRQALLIAGLLEPSTEHQKAKRGDAFETLPVFRLRWPMSKIAESDVFMTFCCRYKLTLTPTKRHDWLVPWFRLRELPTASLRNWHANHSARVGFVSLT